MSCIYSLSRLTTLSFFFTDTPTTSIYTLSLHDALPISALSAGGASPKTVQCLARHSTITLTMDRHTHLNLMDETAALDALPALDRKSTRLNSSHANISYAVFCLKKKKREDVSTTTILNI